MFSLGNQSLLHIILHRILDLDSNLIILETLLTVYSEFLDLFAQKHDFLRKSLRKFGKFI